MSNNYLIRKFYNSSLLIRIHNKEEFNELFKICTDLAKDSSPKLQDYDYMITDVIPFNNGLFPDGSFIMEARDDGEYGLSWTFTDTDIKAIENYYGKENIIDFSKFKAKLSEKENIK